MMCIKQSSPFSFWLQKQSICTSARPETSRRIWRKFLIVIVPSSTISCPHPLLPWLTPSILLLQLPSSSHLPTLHSHCPSLFPCLLPCCPTSLSPLSPPFPSFCTSHSFLWNFKHFVVRIFIDFITVFSLMKLLSFRKNIPRTVFHFTSNVFGIIYPPSNHIFFLMMRYFTLLRKWKCSLKKVLAFIFLYSPEHYLPFCLVVTVSDFVILLSGSTCQLDCILLLLRRHFFKIKPLITIDNELKSLIFTALHEQNLWIRGKPPSTKAIRLSVCVWSSSLFSNHSSLRRAQSLN